MGKRSVVIIGIVWLIIIVASVSSVITLAVSSGAMPFDASASEGRAQALVDSDETRIAELYGRLDEIRKIVKSEFYTEVEDDQLINGAIRGLLASVNDDYTFYYTPEEMLNMNEHTEGVYEGIGLLLSGDKNGLLTVLRVFHNSPSKKSGVVAGDRIIAINGTPVSAETTKAVNDAIDIVKHSENRQIILTLLRNGKNVDVSVVREKIQINRVDYEILPGNIGYLAIYEFMGDDVSGFKEAIAYFEQNGVKGIVLDLRSNPGGLLHHVVEISDILLPEGLIVYIEDRYGKRDNYYSKVDYLDIPMVVLVNGMSASASEILAGALKDYNLATIVGETTFGKGIVQTVIPFRSDGAGMQLTTARYFTPSGVCIHGVGIEPDVHVVQNEDYDASVMTVDPEKDNQLKAGLEELQKRIDAR